MQVVPKGGGGGVSGGWRGSVENLKMFDASKENGLVICTTMYRDKRRPGRGWVKADSMLKMSQRIFDAESRWESTPFYPAESHQTNARRSILLLASLLPANRPR